MKELTQEAANKLIAEFMGSKPHQDDRYGEMWPDPTANNTYRHGLRYDTSWDWLMLVVDKISEYRLVYPDEANEVCNCKIVIGKQHLYEKCVAFIQWYNSKLRKGEGHE